MKRKKTHSIGALSKKKSKTVISLPRKNNNVQFIFARLHLCGQRVLFIFLYYLLILNEIPTQTTTTETRITYTTSTNNQF